ncbi:MAG: radical SAM protein [Proteobacteria bacterium]|nr:radical SAM protein [Pseudomonadota bacterium]
MADVLLIQPPPQTRNKGGSLAEPIGLEYVGAMLREHGHTADIVDAWIDGLSVDAVAAEVARRKPDVLGITATSVLMPNAWEVARRVKEISPDIPVVCGGAHAIYEPAWTLGDPSIDVAIVGEGEDAILELIDVWNGTGTLDDVAGIAYRGGDGEVVKTKGREYNDHLDRLPFPLRNDRHMEGYTLYEVVGKRGCPFKCSFCGASADHRKVRFRSPENVMEEVAELFGRYGKKKLYFNDDVFSINKQWTHDFCDLLIRRQLDIEWECQTRVDLVDLELLTKMKAAGCESVVFGIDAGNQENFDRLNKAITVEQAYVSVRHAREAGLAVWCNFIMGYPWETARDLQDTIALARGLDPHFARFFMATPYPGSPLYQYAKERDLILSYDLATYSQDSGTSILRLEHLTQDELSRFVYRANMLFYLRPQAFLKAMSGYRRQGRWKALARAVPAFAEYVARVRSHSGPVVTGAVPGNLPGERGRRQRT